jgi:hypothetical protein
MKPFAVSLIASLAACLLQPSAALAQASSSDDQARVRAEKRAEGTAESRNFMSAEGNPIPEPRAKASRDERVQARQARKPESAAAAKSYRTGEGDPKPTATAKIPSDQRRAERVAKRDEVKAANKAGQIPSYGDNYPLK